jgi:hypothetical protein
MKPLPGRPYRSVGAVGGAAPDLGQGHSGNGLAPRVENADPGIGAKLPQRPAFRA